jgi:hypothetical protein
LKSWDLKGRRSILTQGPGNVTSTAINIASKEIAKATFQGLKGFAEGVLLHSIDREREHYVETCNERRAPWASNFTEHATFCCSPLASILKLLLTLTVFLT